MCVCVCAPHHCWTQQYTCSVKHMYTAVGDSQCSAIFSGEVVTYHMYSTMEEFVYSCILVCACAHVCACTCVYSCPLLLLLQVCCHGKRVVRVAVQLSRDKRTLLPSCVQSASFACPVPIKCSAGASQDQLYPPTMVVNVIIYRRHYSRCEG